MEGQNSRRGELMRRHSRHLSRSDSNRTPDTDDDSENSRCPSPLLTIEGGYRIDPFVHFPLSRASKGVRFMADYCKSLKGRPLGHAHTLQISKYGHLSRPQALSVQSGRNTLLALVLPLAFQNSMLFEATIAMTRAAWVLRRGSEPFFDKMLLRYRGMAMKELRDSLIAHEQPNSSLVLLTMSTLLTLNVRLIRCDIINLTTIQYMINDLESFEVHLHALESMLASTNSEGDNEIRNFVRGRVLA